MVNYISTRLFSMHLYDNSLQKLWYVENCMKSFESWKRKVACIGPKDMNDHQYENRLFRLESSRGVCAKLQKVHKKNKVKIHIAYKIHICFNLQCYFLWISIFLNSMHVQRVCSCSDLCISNDTIRNVFWISRFSRVVRSRFYFQ